MAARIPGEEGFFVEAGANDGLTESNTLLFERHRSWTGLLIEAIPDLAARCRANRPDAAVAQVALVPFDYPRPTIRMHYSDLMSVVEGARGGERGDLEWAELGFRTDLNYPDYASPRELEVVAAPLSTVLDQHGVTHIDLLSLDVEGYEPSVLRGLDLSRHRPTFVVVEVWDDEAVDALLLGEYERVGVLCSHRLEGRSWHDVLYRVRNAAKPQ